MIVHYVEMNDVGPGGDHVAHLFAKAGEIGGKDAGGNAISGHGSRDFGTIRYSTLARPSEFCPAGRSCRRTNQHKEKLWQLMNSRSRSDPVS